MPASVVPLRARREGTYVFLESALPGRPPERIGVLLLDVETGRGWLRMRHSCDNVAAPEDAEVLEALEEDIRQRIEEMGAPAVLAWFEDTLSNALRVSERQAVAVDSFTRTIEQIYSRNVEDVPVERYTTHVPLFTLRAAAGHLGEEMAVEPEDWVPAPEGMKLDSNVFAAHVVGRSMEPRIPDGSLNLFRFHPVGSRTGKILLIERFGVLDDTARYTVKLYTSTKEQPNEDEWHHTGIRLRPLNPEFEAWDVGPEDFAVVAEWIRVLD